MKWGDMERDEKEVQNCIMGVSVLGSKCYLNDMKYTRLNIILLARRFWRRLYSGIKVKISACLVIHSCLTLCKPMDCRTTGSFVHGDSPSKNEWVAMPSSRDLPNPGIEPRSPALQVDSLPSGHSHIYNYLTELNWMQYQ